LQRQLVQKNPKRRRAAAVPSLTGVLIFVFCGEGKEDFPRSPALLRARQERGRRDGSN